MADAVSVRVEPRDPAKNKGTGTRVTRRLRAKGLIPARDLWAQAGRRADRPDARRRLANDQNPRPTRRSRRAAERPRRFLIRDVQWDHLGKEILHLDFARVSAEEVIETEVSLELRGVAAGIASGGILEHLVHSLRIKCPAGAIPSSIKVDVSHLEVDQGVHVRDLILPPDVTVDADEDLLLVHVVVRADCGGASRGRGRGCDSTRGHQARAQGKRKRGLIEIVVVIASGRPRPAR